jgi:hypothetical protein
VALLFIVFLIGILLPINRGMPREAVRRYKCQNNLKQIALAMLNYESQYGKLPPAYTVDENGAPLHSWRVLILPQLGEQEVYDSIDLTKPWNDPVNEHARKLSLGFYRCPSSNIPDGQTTYLANAWEGGLFVPGKGKTSIIPDGSSNTIMAFEVSSEMAVEWMSPVDGDHATLVEMLKSYRSPHNGLFMAAFADGSTHSFVAPPPTNSKHDRYLPLFTIDAGDEFKWD